MREAAARYRRGELAAVHGICREILARAPDFPPALHLLSLAAYGLKDFPRCAALLQRAIRAEPANAIFHGLMGAALVKLKRFEAAIASLDRAIALKPDYPQALSNRGLAYQELLDFGAAAESFDRAIAIKPDYTPAYFNKARLLLLIGDWERGWQFYEARWKTEAFRTERRVDGRAPWLGDETLAGRRIFLHSEQGFGDTIQFCRYAGMVAGLGATVILSVQKPLLGLLRSLGGVSTLIASDDPVPPFDGYCPLMGLPLAFKTEVDSVPSCGSYLTADANRVGYWAGRLGERAGPRIGLTWSGSSVHQNLQDRSLPLALLLKYLPPSCDYVSLQKEIRDSDRAALQASPIRHFGDALEDFSDTAALTTLMDLVISVDTSTAHLAGALGKETWLLLPFRPDWRWLLERRDTPWYPGMRLYRQQSFERWERPLEELAADLAAHVRAAAGDRPAGSAKGQNPI